MEKKEGIIRRKMKSKGEMTERKEESPLYVEEDGRRRRRRRKNE